MTIQHDTLVNVLDQVEELGARRVLEMLGVRGDAMWRARVHLMFDECSPVDGLEYAAGLWDAGRAREARHILDAVLTSTLGQAGCAQVEQACEAWLTDVPAGNRPQCPS